MRVLVLGMAVVFGGYTVASYGWVLIKGWDIHYRQWISPLNPYTWPKGGADPPPIPADRLFPGSPAAGGSASGAAGSRSTAGETLPKPLRQSPGGALLPGQAPGR